MPEIRSPSTPAEKSPSGITLIASSVSTIEPKLKPQQHADQRKADRHHGSTAA